MQVEEVVQESPTAFLHKLDNEEEDFSKPMKFVSDRCVISPHLLPPPTSSHHLTRR